MNFRAFLSLLVTTSALAQTGADRCADAPLLTTGITYPWTTAGARPDGSCSCFDTSPRTRPDLYYKFIADRDGYLTASACAGPVAEAALAIFEGCDGPEIACNDDFCGFRPQVGSMVLAGRTYIIRLVAPGGNPRTGVLNLTFEPRCLIRKPFGALVEPERCGQRLNDGCFAGDPDAVIRASFGQTYYGSYFGLADGTLDYDVYRFSIDQRQVVELAATGGIDTLLLLYRSDCDLTRPLAQKFASPCEPARIRFTLPPGTYDAAVRVFPPANNNDCGLPFQNTNYVLTLGDAAPLCTPDFNGDGFLDFFDYDAYVTCFITPNDCPDFTDADLNADGFTDFSDFSDFVRAFEAGC
jgi:hypothetical protein